MYAAIRQSNIYNNISTFGIIMYIFKHIFVIDVLHFVFPLECPLTKKTTTCSIEIHSPKFEI